MNCIVGQQIATKAQTTIWNRMLERFGEVTPEAMAACSDDELQQVGISFRKVGYIKGAAARVLSGEVDLEGLAELSDDEVCRTLSALPGIGVWTAEMLMTFSMQRPNILSWGDLAIHRGLRMVHHHRRITPELFAKYRRRYTPYGSVASLYLWEVAGGAEDGAVLHVAGKRGRAMSGSLVALCADTTSLQHPESIGLAGENLAAQDWLRIFSSAEEARRFLRTDRLVDEVWVASSDDVAPINLAATLKRDRSDRCVCMLSFEDTGSLKSRMSATGIDASLTRQALAERYARRKQAFACPWPMAAPAAPRQAPMPAAMPVSVAPATAPQPARCDERRPGARAGFLFPVVSGSGGAGKSTVSVLSALIAQRMGYNTLLLDFDLQFGDAPALMGVQNPLAVDDVLAVPSRLDQLRSDGRMPALLAAPRHLEDSEAVVERAPQLLDQLTARFDVVVANTGAAWAEQHALLLERSSKALFLIDQRPSSLRACQHALDLCARCGIATGPFLYAVNRCSKNALFTSIDVSCSLRGAHVFELKDGGGEVEELLGAGLPFDLLASRNDLCASLERVLSGVLPGDRRAAAPPEEGASRGPGFRLPVGKKPRRRRKEAPCL